jgi:hypothetical protein
MKRHEVIKKLNAVGLAFYGRQEPFVSFVQQNPKDPVVKQLCTINNLRIKLKTSVYKLHRDIQWGRHE